MAILYNPPHKARNIEVKGLDQYGTKSIRIKGWQGGKKRW